MPAVAHRVVTSTGSYKDQPRTGRECQSVEATPSNVVQLFLPYPDQPSPPPQNKAQAPGILELGRAVRKKADDLLEMTERAAGIMDFDSFEKDLIEKVFGFARALLAGFLALSRERFEASSADEPLPPGFERRQPKPRTLGTFFGKVEYWRGYLYNRSQGGGFFPLDAQLGLAADGFCLGLLGRAVQLATKMSYTASTTILSSFLGWSPSTVTLEKATLGLGRFTQEWFEAAPPPENDGEVLVIQVDSKGTPTATEEELRKRRGPRKANPFVHSQRHRGRLRRARRTPRKRRKKGEKSKNARMSTLVVIYTLRRERDEDGQPILIGPLNRRVYASYAPRRHAMAIARREADKRGFTADSGKTIQLVTDGDEELERCAREFFPEAIHTLDVIHAIEYLWRAASCLFEEGGDEMAAWVQEQKEHLYAGEAYKIVIDGDQKAPRIVNQAKRERFQKCMNYLAKRVDMMNYKWLMEQDLELASGIVEGAVRYVISQRFDEGGMRWIRERAEALLQLRCIELNGDWDAFLDFVRRKLRQEFEAKRRHPRILQNTPQPLPQYGLSTPN